MKPLIFLDIDGVLNGHEFDRECLCGRIDRDKMARLNDILRATDARVVVSSAWRYLVHRGEMNQAGLEWLLRSHGMIAGRLRGITRMDLMVPRPPYDGNPEGWVHTDERGEQIREWLAINTTSVPPYVVLDDLDLGISAAGHPFVQTDGKVGLTDADAARAVERLSRVIFPQFGPHVVPMPSRQEPSP